jgi:hypothetical protein
MKTLQQAIDALGTDEVERRTRKLKAERRHSDPRIGYYFPTLTRREWIAKLRETAGGTAIPRGRPADAAYFSNPTTANYVAAFCKFNHLTMETKA